MAAQFYTQFSDVTAPRAYGTWQLQPKVAQIRVHNKLTTYQPALNLILTLILLP